MHVLLFAKNKTTKSKYSSDVVKRPRDPFNSGVETRGSLSYTEPAVSVTLWSRPSEPQPHPLMITAFVVPAETHLYGSPAASTNTRMRAQEPPDSGTLSTELED